MYSLGSKGEEKGFEKRKSLISIFYIENEGTLAIFYRQKSSAGT